MASNLGIVMLSHKQRQDTIDVVSMKPLPVGTLQICSRLHLEYYDDLSKAGRYSLSTPFPLPRSTNPAGSQIGAANNPPVLYSRSVASTARCIYPCLLT